MQTRLADARVKFRHLQCFLAVAQFGSVQQAAESLSITQPAVSKTIAELESVLGVRLFERGRHGAVPTREGQLFMPHASACVSALRQGVELLARDEGGVAATLDVGVLPTVATDVLSGALRRFVMQWPRVSVRLSTVANAELLERLKSGAISFAIGRLADPERMVGLSFELRAGHPLTQGGGFPAQLAQYPLVLPPFGTLIRQAADSLLAAWGAQTLPAFVEMLSVSVGRALALENDAVWFVPDGAVEYDLRQGALVRLPLPPGGGEEPVGLILRTDTQPSPAGRALIEAVKSVARERTARPENQPDTRRARSKRSGAKAAAPGARSSTRQR
jgi:LysR family transcriptional regulator, pca operon transcriptional activator